MLLFSHGYSGTHDQNTSIKYMKSLATLNLITIGICEQLASHGFIVVSFDHTYDATITVFPDSGEVAIFRAAPPKHISDEDLWILRNKHLQIRTQDAIFIFNLLEKINNGQKLNFVSSPSKLEKFKGVLDLDSVGIFGRKMNLMKKCNYSFLSNIDSFGGGTAMTSCACDKRFKGCIGLDPWTWPLDPSIKENGIKTPFLNLQAPSFFSEDLVTSRNNRKELAKIIEAMKKQNIPAFSFTILGTKHHDFADLCFYAPFLTRFFGITGSINGERMQEILFQYSFEFWKEILPNKYLQSLKSSSNSSPFSFFSKQMIPEVKIN